VALTNNSDRIIAAVLIDGSRKKDNRCSIVDGCGGKTDHDGTRQRLKATPPAAIACVLVRTGCGPSLRRSVESLFLSKRLLLQLL
jgi:hypothetical protein